MTDASMPQSGQLPRRARPIGSRKATQIASEGETPSQTEPAIRARLREALRALARTWPVVAGDPRQRIPAPSGREAVDLPVAVVNRSPEAVCRFAVGVEDSCPHWVPNGRKNGATRGQLGAKTGPKVCQTDPRADKNGLAEHVMNRALAMESQTAETFVNQSFRSSPEGSIAAQLTFGNGVQGGQGAHCQLTVSGFCEWRSWGGNRKAAPKDRLISGPAYRLEPFEGVLEGVLDQVGVDLGGGEVPVPKRPFDHQDIAGAAVEVGGEGVAQGVGTEALVDTRLAEPVYLTRLATCPWGVLGFHGTRCSGSIGKVLPDTKRIFEVLPEHGLSLRGSTEDIPRPGFPSARPGRPGYDLPR